MNTARGPDARTAPTGPAPTDAAHRPPTRIGDLIDHTLAYLTELENPDRVRRTAMHDTATATVIGNLTADPDLHTTSTGESLATFTVAATARHRHRGTGEAAGGDTLFLHCVAWRTLAENVAASLRRGTRVCVHGRLRQRDQDTRDGALRTVVELDVDEIGPSLRFATASIHTRPRRTRTVPPQPTAPRYPPRSTTGAVESREV